MPEDVQSTPLEGAGSKTPAALPSLHTPVGEGAGTTGVNNVGKAKGTPGAPAGGALGGLGGDAGGVSPLGGNIPEVKTPEDLLVDRSNDRLGKDLQDVYLQYFKDNDKDAPQVKSSSLKLGKIKYDINDIDFDYVIDRLINQKGWHVDRLKELLPSRDEKTIKEYFNKILNSNTLEEVDVNQQENNTLDMFNNKQGSNNLMSKNDLIVDNGAIKTASSAELLDQISYSISKVRSARKNLKKAYLTKVGFEAIKDMADKSGEDAGFDMDVKPGLDGMDDGLDVDIKAFGDGLGGEKDLKSLVDDVKDALDILTEKVEEFGLTSDTMSSDEMLKGDSLIDKAKDEMEGADNDLAAIDSFESKSKEKKEKPAVGKKEEENEDSEEKEEGKFASAGEQYKPEERGKKINPTITDTTGGWEQKGGKAEGSDQAMKVTTGAKEAHLMEIKNRLASLKQARENSMKQADYPFNDLNKQEVTDQMRTDAVAQSSEINKDMSGGFKADNESLSPKGIVEDVKDPGMSVSEPADIKKAAVDDYNKVASAANSLARKAVAQAVAKTRVAMEVSSMQQLKGLLVNPLKDELVARFAEYGVNKADAQALIHNAFVKSYEDSQKIVIAEAFDTLANKEDNELVKVASFTKEFKVASADNDQDDMPVEKATEDIKEASAEAKTVKTASLRGSQVNNDNSQVYTGFWRAAYEESKGL